LRADPKESLVIDKSKIALVTGANRGIGLEACRQLAARGCQVILTARDRGKGERAAQALAPAADVAVVELDVTSAASIRRAASEVADRFGRLDVLINNAAVLVGDDASIFDISVDDFRATFDTNVFGVVAVSQAFVPAMITRGYGRVVNVSSGAGQLAGMNDYAPAYSVSKAALNALTRQLAAATKGTGVLVNCMNPGWVRTDMGGRSAPRSVEEGADTIVWLATLADDGPTGGFFSNRRPIDW
jgi:NAD(P)-dependent dehydrogenase (short-subunit alcohol dehydrogenase family)